MIYIVLDYFFIHDNLYQTFNIDIIEDNVDHKNIQIIRFFHFLFQDKVDYFRFDYSHTKSYLLKINTISKRRCC